MPAQGYAPPQQPFAGFPEGQPRYAPPGYPPPPVPPQLSPAGEPLAPFGDRLLAYLIDAAIAFVVTLVVFGAEVIAVVVWVAPGATSARPDGTAGPGSAANLRLVPVYAAAILLMLVFIYTYYVEWVLRHGGQTVGKRLMKLRITPLDPRAPLTRGMLVKRSAVTIGCYWVPGLFYLDGLWQLWDKPYQQCLHDKWPRTVVVSVPQ